MRHSGPLVGLTGGIASGKSKVAQFLKDLGWRVIDADELSRKLAAPGGKAEPEILTAFGTTDRTELRKLVFQNSEARKTLEKILHPWIQKESQVAIAEAWKNNPKGVAYEAALLLEAGRAQDFPEGILLVTAPHAIRVQRLVQNRHLDADEAERIIQSQWSDEKRRSLCRWEIVNDGTTEELFSKVKEWEQKCRIA